MRPFIREATIAPILAHCPQSISDQPASAGALPGRSSNEGESAMKKPGGIAPVLWIAFGLVAGVVIGAIVGHVGWGAAFGLVAGAALMAILTGRQGT